MDARVKPAHDELGCYKASRFPSSDRCTTSASFATIPTLSTKRWRGAGLPPQAQRLIALDEQRRAKILALETAQARRNAASKEIGEAKKNKDEEKAKGLLSEVAALKETIPAMEAEEKKASKALDDALAEIPNLPLDEVPDGKDEKDNVEHHRFGAKRDYAFAPKQHFDLGEALGQMDFETAAKLSGARFVVLKKGLARLERALGQFMLDVHTSEPHNYTEVSPPLLVRDEAMFGTRNCRSSRTIKSVRTSSQKASFDAVSIANWINCLLRYRCEG